MPLQPPVLKGHFFCVARVAAHSRFHCTIFPLSIKAIIYFNCCCIKQCITVKYACRDELLVALISSDQCYFLYSTQYSYMYVYNDTYDFIVLLNCFVTLKYMEIMRGHFVFYYHHFFIFLLPLATTRSR